MARAGEDDKAFFREILGEVKPYRSILEWAHHNSLIVLDTNDVGSQWHEHHAAAVGEANENTLRENAVAFFRIAEAAGFGAITVGRGGKSTRLDLVPNAVAAFVETDVEDESGAQVPTLDDQEDGAAAEAFEEVDPTPQPGDIAKNRKVFITHGKNKKIVDQLKKLLTFGQFEPVVSVERESVSQPVPAKVLGDMRACAAAVIHVGVEQRLVDDEGNEVNVLNPNVLIEIGAAMMGYGRNFILLVEDGTKLPSNLQGLYEVRYKGDGLDHDSTMKLLEAFNEFK